MNSTEQGTRSKGSDHRLRFSAIVLLTLAICVPTLSAASELRWRNEREASAQKTAPAKSRTALQFVRPQTVSRRNDPLVRPAAFEEEVPRLTSGRDAETKNRSVVVNRDDAPDSFRSAQLPQIGAGVGSTDTQIPANTDSTTTDSVQTPFGDTPSEPPQLQNPQLQTPQTTESNTTLQTPQGASQREQRQPAQLPAQQPAKQPMQFPPPDQPTAAPPIGQFQPVLPSGPTEPEGTGPPVPTTIPPATLQAEGAHAKESCDQSLQNLRAYTVDKVNLNISVKGTEGQDYPFECKIDDGSQFPGRCWEQTTYMWKASALCHKPLYFEDEQLERYGHSFSPCFQPFISGAHFFTRLPVLPYCMGVEPPCECVYALGYYRPGNCAPYMCNPIPISPRGALFEVGAVTGAAAALP